MNYLQALLYAYQFYFVFYLIRTHGADLAPTRRRWQVFCVSSAVYMVCAIVAPQLDGVRLW